MKTIILPVIAKPPRLRVDRSATVAFDTRELTNEEVGELRDAASSEGWLVFSASTTAPEELTKLVPSNDPEMAPKTPSQRLRATLFVFYKQSGEKDWESFYKEHMEKLIDFVKTKLD